MITLEQRKVVKVDPPKAGFYMLHFDDGEKKLVPRLTTKLGVLDKPALKFWAANIEREYVIEKAANTFATMRVPNPLDVQAAQQAQVPIQQPQWSEGAELFKVKLLAKLGEKKAHQMRLKEAGAIGTGLHLMVQNALRQQMGLSIAKKPKESDSALLAFMAWEDWSESVELEPTHVETSVGSETMDVAGTMDCAGYAFNENMDGHKTHTFFDWKSSKRSSVSPNGIYPESEIQVSVYRALGIEMGIGDERSWAAVVRLPKNEDDPCLQEKEPFDVLWISPERADYLAAGFLHIGSAFSFMKEAFPK